MGDPKKKIRRMRDQASMAILTFLMMLAILLAMAPGGTYCLFDTAEIQNEFTGKEGGGTEPPVTPGNTILTVVKVWIPAKGHPDYIRVDLYGDGVYDSSIILNEGNKWMHAWKGLSDDMEWTVKEEPTPGYDTRISHEGDRVTITNTKKAPPPVEPPPVEPPPVEPPPVGPPPVKPPPVTPPPVKPPPDEGGEILGILREDIYGIDESRLPGGGLDAGLPDNLPKTGDETDPRPWLILLAASAPILRYILFRGRQQTKRKGEDEYDAESQANGRSDHHVGPANDRDLYLVSGGRNQE